jgi:hypothetical protein
MYVRQRMFGGARDHGDSVIVGLQNREAAALLAEPAAPAGALHFHWTLSRRWRVALRGLIGLRPCGGEGDKLLARLDRSPILEICET